MPLQKLEFRPGVNREGTTLANEGGWFESDKVRFRSGFPEKIGGWVKDQGFQNPKTPNITFVSDGMTTGLPPQNGSFWGTCRTLYNWLTLAGNNLLAAGTNLKYYIQDSVNGPFYDVTPVRYNATVTSTAFTTTISSSIVRCNVPSHDAKAGDFVVISGVTGSVNGIPDSVLNTEFRVVTVISSSIFTINVGTLATSSGTTGTATFAIQETTGSDIYTTASGWGSGGWGGVTPGFPNTGWGEAGATGIGVNLRLYSQSAFGENLVFNARGGPINFWAVNPNTTFYDRGQVIKAGGTVKQKDYAAGVGTINVPIDATCPSIVNFVMVSDASRFTIVFGCNDPTGLVVGTELDPMMIRWSDQESYSTWTPAVTNQAGSYRLSQGSQIITAIQTRQEILVWTDSSIYSMQFVGAPYVWSFQIMGANLSIISPNAAVTVNNITYWMGTDKFYMYSGRVETLPCSLRQYIYDDINLLQGFQVVSGSNEGYNEIWWFYCSANSNQVNRYVIYNHLERTWAYGSMSRTSWLDSPLRVSPMATTYNNAMVYHEQGNDDGTTTPPSPIYAYVRSSDFDIGDGHNFGLVWRIIPDLTFDGSNSQSPTVNFTVFPRQNPGANYGTTDNPAVISADDYSLQRTYNVQRFTEYAYVRIRGRQMAFQISSEDLGVSWQLGSPRLDVRADGRR